MNLKTFIPAFAAILLVSNQFFSYPVFASDGETSQVAEQTQVKETHEPSKENQNQDSPIIDVQVSGNGSGSENKVEITRDSSDEVSQTNKVEIVNNIKINANTGDNKASDNKGNVSIKTGDVNISVGVVNQVNTNNVVDECDCEAPKSPPAGGSTPTPKPSETPKPSTPPSGGECCSTSNPPSGGGNNGSGSSGGSGGPSLIGSGGGGGQVLGATLPATGGFSLVQASMFALSLLASGIILRLDFRRKKKHVKKLKQYITFAFFYETAQSFGKHVNWKLPLPVPRNLLTRFTGISPPLSSRNSKLQIPNYNS